MINFLALLAVFTQPLQIGNNVDSVRCHGVVICADTLPISVGMRRFSVKIVDHGDEGSIQYEQIGGPAYMEYAVGRDVSRLNIVSNDVEPIVVDSLKYAVVSRYALIDSVNQMYTEWIKVDWRGVMLVITGPLKTPEMALYANYMTLYAHIRRIMNE